MKRFILILISIFCCNTGIVLAQSANDKDITIWVYNLDKDYKIIGKPKQYSIEEENNINVTNKLGTFVDIYYEDKDNRITFTSEYKTNELNSNPKDGLQKPKTKAYRVKPAESGIKELSIKKDGNKIATIQFKTTMNQQ